MTKVYRFTMASDDGATAAEYSLLLLLVAMAIFAAIGALGTAVTGALTSFATGF